MDKQLEQDFQNEVFNWCVECFGKEITYDITERNHRFLEESLELIQTTGATKSECHQLVDYVFDRPTGETKQELGGVMVTLAALSNAIRLSMYESGWLEVARIWAKIEKIREKQAAKPKHSPLLIAGATSSSTVKELEESLEGCREIREGLELEVERLKGLIEKTFKGNLSGSIADKDLLYNFFRLENNL